MKNEFPPESEIIFTVSVPPFSLRSTTAILTPSLESRRDAALPIPELDPVTRATLFASRFAVKEKRS